MAANVCVCVYTPACSIPNMTHMFPGPATPTDDNVLDTPPMNVHSGRVHSLPQPSPRLRTVGKEPHLCATTWHVMCRPYRQITPTSVRLDAVSCSAFFDCCLTCVARPRTLTRRVLEIHREG